MTNFILFAANIDNPEYVQKMTIFIAVIGFAMVASLVIGQILAERRR